MDRRKQWTLDKESEKCSTTLLLPLENRDCVGTTGMNCFDYLLRSEPTFITFSYSSKEHRRLDLTGLKRTLLQSVNELPIFRTDNLISDDIYIYDKLLYKMNGPFRRHRHFQLAKRLKKLLCRCFVGDQCHVKKCGSILRQFADAIELDTTDKAYCPCKEYFQFSLVNLRLLASMLLEIMRTCVELCQRVTHMLDLGHFVQPHCILLAVVAGFRSDCYRRLKLLKQFFVSFDSQGYVAKGLRLKAVQGVSSELDELFLKIFSDLEEMDSVLDQNGRIVDELSPAMRDEATRFFEGLFNVRLVQQQEQRRRVKANATVKSMQQMNFRGALVTRTPVLSTEDDFGVPIETVIDSDDDNGIKKTPSDKGVYARKVKKLRTLKSMERFARQLEMENNSRCTRALRFLQKELAKLNNFKDDDGKQARRFMQIRRQLNILLRDPQRQ